LREVIPLYRGGFNCWILRNSMNCCGRGINLKIVK
jgi:hypothetical protein